MPEKDLRIPTTPEKLAQAVMKPIKKAEIKYESRSPIKTTLAMQRVGKKAERQSVSWTSISGSSVTMRIPPAS